MHSRFLALALSLAVAPLCLGQSTEAADFFEAKVRPVLLARCSSCHGDKVQMGQKQFTTREGMHRSGAVVPGDPEASALIQAVRYGGKVKMPPAGKLAALDIEYLEKWVRSGAIWPEQIVTAAVGGAAGHWALQPVKAAAAPMVKDADWPRGKIDRFILAKLEEKRLAPAADADRYTLLRRLTLDLTGLLPTPEEVTRFIDDPSPRALDTVAELDTVRGG